VRNLIFYRRALGQPDEEAEKNGVWVGSLRPMRKKPAVGVFKDNVFHVVAYCNSEEDAVRLQEALSALVDVDLSGA